jgi:hypothetical protein
VVPAQRTRCYLIPGDSPIGYRLPLDSQPWAARATIRGYTCRPQTAGLSRRCRPTRAAPAVAPDAMGAAGVESAGATLGADSGLGFTAHGGGWTPAAPSMRFHGVEGAEGEAALPLPGAAEAALATRDERIAPPAARRPSNRPPGSPARDVRRAARRPLYLFMPPTVAARGLPRARRRGRGHGRGDCAIPVVSKATSRRATRASRVSASRPTRA